MINIAKTLDWSFWFAIHSPAMSLNFALMLSALFVVMIAGYFLARGQYRKLKKLDRFVSYFWRKLASMLLMMGTIGLVLVFCAYEGVALFGMRLWFMVWALVALIWLGRIFFYRYKEMPEMLSKNHEAAMKTT